MSLISADQLRARLDEGDDTVRVVDVRWYLNRPGVGRAAYDAGHIPGAIFLDLDHDLADPDGLGAPGRHPLPQPGQLAERLGERGIGSDSFVVAYDDAGGTVAARLWWMLDSLGHRGGAAVLDGGLRAWLSAGGELSGDEPHHAPQALELAQQWGGVIERHELAARLGQLVVLDARAAERYRGEVEPIDPQAGHIPTALSTPATDSLDEGGRLHEPGLLRQRLSPLAGDRTVAYCGSGATACHLVLAMRVAGLPAPRLYAGSFSDWSRSGMPVVAGAQAGGSDQLDSPK